MFSLILPGQDFTIQDPLSSGEKASVWKDANLGTLVSQLLVYIMPIAAIILFIMLLVGGFTLLTSTGNEEKVQKGKHLLTSAIIGFVIIFIAYWIMQILEIVLGINVGFLSTGGSSTAPPSGADFNF